MRNLNARKMKCCRKSHGLQLIRKWEVKLPLFFIYDLYFGHCFQARLKSNKFREKYWRYVIFLSRSYVIIFVLCFILIQETNLFSTCNFDPASIVPTNIFLSVLIHFLVIESVAFEKRTQLFHGKLLELFMAYMRSLWLHLHVSQQTNKLYANS